MKYCSHCGNEVMDESIICPKCGCAVGYQTVKQKNIQSNNGLKTAAKVFMVICTVIMGFYLIPLAWCIPMTIIYFKKVNNGEEVSTAFKICCLLFVSLFAGIFMLCDRE